MLRSVFTKTLFDQRWGVLGWGLGLGLLVIVTGYGWAVAYPHAADRALFASQVEGGLSAINVLYGEPHNVAEMGGFIQWRTLGVAPLLLGAFAIIAATGVTRGAEESGTLEVVLTSPLSRRRVLAQQVAGLLAAVLIAVVVVAVCLVPTGAIAGEPSLAVPDIAGAMLNVAAATVLFGAFGLFAAQVAARRRTAAIAAIVAMLVCHFADTIPLAATGLEPVRYISPLYLTSRTTALANGHVDWLAMAGVAFLAVAVGALAFVMAVRRDIFATYPLGARLPRPPRPRLAGWSMPLRSPFTRALRDAAGPSMVWAIGLALLAALLTAFVPNVRQALLDSATSGVAEQLEKAGLLSSSGIIELMVISFTTPIVALFALTLASSWAHEETADRLGFELATPVPRRSLFLGRFAATTVAIAALVAFVALAVAATAWLRGVSIPAGRFTGAMLLLVALGIAVSAVGFAISGIRPGATAAITGLFVAISYFGEALLALAGAPGWLRDISVFALYGQPLIDGISAYQPIALVAIAVTATAIGAARFERRDIVR